MRVLFVVAPGAGHVYPTVSVAQALSSAGHEILYAHGGDVESVSDAGMPVVDTTPGLDYVPVFNPPDGDGTDPLHADRGVQFLADLFTRVSGVGIDGVLRVARAWKPDLIMHVPLQGAARLAAEVLGVPCVELPLGPDDCDPLLAVLLRQGLASHYDRHGVGGRSGTVGRLTVMPPSYFRDLSPSSATEHDVPMRYVPYHGGGAVPDWLLEPARRPRIAVTLGSIEPLWGGIAVLAPLFSSVGGVDAEFVLTVGGGDVSLLGELPPNVRTLDWVPLGPLLETCSGVIHHGGSTTTTTALALGVPQCVIPNGRGPRINAEALIAWGAGIRGEAGTVGADECHELLENGKLRERAAEVAAEMAEMPAPSELVVHLTDLAAGSHVG
ncbi:nucleotide disphospho-sugar-binding domain-containing protein [Streptomyces cyaneofuscatus]|uniref:nucleotide disphospho-sugar-binding domain-containing protein n=1 Tax=Streptomyces cyaneofuscatus TaxID=66883 RepID=UPI0033BEDE66